MEILTFDDYGKWCDTNKVIAVVKYNRNKDYINYIFKKLKIEKYTKYYDVDYITKFDSNREYFWKNNLYSRKKDSKDFWILECLDYKNFENAVSIICNCGAIHFSISFNNTYLFAQCNCCKKRDVVYINFNGND